MELFIINLKKMIFIIQYKDQSSTLLSATTLSDAAAYVEGTGKEIYSISQPYNTATLVLNAPQFNNFYQLTLRNNSTGASTNYFVFEEDFESLNTWIESQSDTEVIQLYRQQRNYVSL
jgi:hypothetical protein